MLEDEIVPCPICDNELKVKVMKTGSYPTKTTYIISDDCSKCKSKSSKIEILLNKRNRGIPAKVERSYFKLDPRG
ncbi:MAG: hypothetical protein HYW22_00075 [Candidatus Aenigmarchaeota archaeon]|nr:hypothetical protein [Candidatus Aenigmarchaeota archaeon]